MPIMGLLSERLEGSSKGIILDLSVEVFKLEPLLKVSVILTLKIYSGVMNAFPLYVKGPGSAENYVTFTEL